MKKSLQLFFLPFIILSLTPLTSCAKAVYYSMPLVVTNQLFDSSSFEENSKDLNTFNTSLLSNSTSYSSKFSDYLKEIKFSYDRNDSSSWVYTNPNTFKKENSGEEKRKIYEGNFKWSLPIVIETNLQNNDYDAKNLNIIAINSANRNISTYLASFFKTLFSFLSQPAIATNPNKDLREKWLNALFGTHPDINDSSKITSSTFNEYQNSLFYDFIFSNTNSFSQSNSLEFDVSSVDYNFTSNHFGPGPLISSTNVLDLLSSEELESILANEYYKAEGGSTHKIYIGADSNEVSKVTKLQQTAKALPLTKDASINYNNHIKYNTVKDGSDKGKIVSASVIEVPISLQVNKLNFGYFNYKTNKQTYNPNEWLASSEEINSVAKGCTSWKKYKDFSKTDIDIKHRTIDTQIINKEKIYFSNDSKSTDSSLSSYSFDGFDPLISKIFTNKGNFIAFAYYSVIVDTDTSGNTHLFPYCWNVSGVTPLWTLFEIQQDGTITLDTKLFKEKNIPGKTAEDKLKYLDPIECAKKTHDKIINFYSSYIPYNNEPFPSNISKKDLIEKVYSLSAFSSLFANSISSESSSSSSSTKASDVFKQI